MASKTRRLPKEFYIVEGKEALLAFKTDDIKNKAAALQGAIDNVYPAQPTGKEAALPVPMDKTGKKQVWYIKKSNKDGVALSRKLTRLVNQVGSVADELNSVSLLVRKVADI